MTTKIRKKRSKLTDKNKEFLRDNRLKMPSRELAEAIGSSKTLVLKFLRDENLQPPKEVIRKFRKKSAAKLSKATSREDAYITANHRTVPIKRMAKNIGRSNSFVRGRLKRLGLVVPEDVIEKNRKQGQFSPGQEPHNKGKKIREYYSAEAMENVKKTWFKKGSIPANAYEKDGAISVVNGYKWIRISLGDWKQLHIHNWEEVNGPLPEGMILIFKDGNKMNCEPENLLPLTRAENMARNTIMRYPPDLRSSMRLLGKLNKKNKQS